MEGSYHRGSNRANLAIHMRPPRPFGAKYKGNTIARSPPCSTILTNSTWRSLTGFSEIWPRASLHALKRAARGK